MTKLYLIAHKVRGEPAFDIAQREMIGDEEGWIIPTSGHRAYPIMFWPLNELGSQLDNCDFISCQTEAGPLEAHPDFASVADHYACNDRTIRTRVDLTSLLANLGVAAPKQIEIKRRL